MKLKVYLAVLMLMSFILCVTGLSFGLPSEKQSALVFSNTGEKNALIPVMKSRRQRIYEYYTSRGVIHSLQSKIPEARYAAVNIDGREIKISEKKIDEIRGFLLQSRLYDESVILKVISQIKWREFDFNPRFFVYGGLYLYPVGAAFKICSLLGLVKTTDNIQEYMEHPDEAAKLFMVPKILGALFFIASIPFLFSAGKEFYNYETGIVASALYSFTPIIIVYSHFFKPHTAILPWVVMCMRAAVKLVNSDKKKWYILAGLFSGFAAGTFSFGGLIILCPAAAHILKSFRNSRACEAGNIISNLFNRNLLFFAAAAALSFLMVNPYWVLGVKDVWAEFVYLSAGLKYFSFSFNGLIKYLFRILPSGVGWAVGMCFFAGLVLSVRRRREADIILLSLIVPFVCYAACSAPHWWLSNLHLSMVIVPSIILLSSRFLAELIQNKRFRILGLAAVGFAVFYTFSNSLYYDLIFLHGDTKMEAGDWINKNIKRGKTIGRKKAVFLEYPPFRLLSYNIPDIDNVSGEPDFYIVMGGVEEADSPAFRRNYKVEKRFKRSFPVWDKIFKNRIMTFIDDEIIIYKKITL